MNGEKELLIEKLAEYAEHNRFSFEELERLIRLCLQLERDCPDVQFVIPRDNARGVEQELRRQAQNSKLEEKPQGEFREPYDAARR